MNQKLRLSNTPTVHIEDNELLEDVIRRLAIRLRYDLTVGVEEYDPDGSFRASVAAATIDELCTIADEQGE